MEIGGQIMPNIGFKTVTLREEVYDHLRKRSCSADTTIARFLTSLIMKGANPTEIREIGDYQRCYRHKGLETSSGVNRGKCGLDVEEAKLHA
jgi:hypothetical protein